MYQKYLWKKEVKDDVEIKDDKDSNKNKTDFIPEAYDLLDENILHQVSSVCDISCLCVMN